MLIFMVTLLASYKTMACDINSRYHLWGKKKDVFHCPIGVQSGCLFSRLRPFFAGSSEIVQPGQDYGQDCIDLPETLTGERQLD